MYHKEKKQIEEEQRNSMMYEDFLGRLLSCFGEKPGTIPGIAGRIRDLFGNNKHLTETQLKQLASNGKIRKLGNHLYITIGKTFKLRIKEGDKEMKYIVEGSDIERIKTNSRMPLDLLKVTKELENDTKIYQIYKRNRKTHEVEHLGDYNDVKNISTGPNQGYLECSGKDGEYRYQYILYSRETKLLENFSKFLVFKNRKKTIIEDKTTGKIDTINGKIDIVSSGEDYILCKVKERPEKHAFEKSYHNYYMLYKNSIKGEKADRIEKKEGKIIGYKGETEVFVIEGNKSVIMQNSK